MDQQPSPPSTGPAGLVEQARALLSELTETLWWAKTPEEIVGVVQQLEMLRAQIAGVQVSAITEVQARGIARTGWPGARPGTGSPTPPAPTAAPGAAPPAQPRSWSGNGPPPTPHSPAVRCPRSRPR